MNNHKLEKYNLAVRINRYYFKKYGKCVIEIKNVSKIPLRHLKNFLHQLEKSEAQKCIQKREKNY